MEYKRYAHLSDLWPKFHVNGIEHIRHRHGIADSGATSQMKFVAIIKPKKDGEIDIASFIYGDPGPLPPVIDPPEPDEPKDTEPPKPKPKPS